jgi:recombination protein RecT
MNEITAPPAPSAPAISRASFKPLKECATLEEAFETREFRDRIEGSVPQHVQPQRMLRTFITAANKTPLLYQASVRSFVGACLTLSQVGLEPNTPLGNAFLIPFKNKKWDPKTRQNYEVVEINVIFGYPGLLDLSYRTGLVKSVHADVVWPGHEFSFEYGSNAHLMHKPIGAPRDPNARPVYAYMHAALRDGQAFEVLPYSDVLAIRDKAQAYRYALAARRDAEANGKRLPGAWTEAPWVAHEIAMARKTAFRAGSKWLPRSVELAAAIALDEAQERRRSMDFGAVTDAPTIDGKADYLGAAADAALRDEEEERPVDPGTAYGVRSPTIDASPESPPVQPPAPPPQPPAPPPAPPPPAPPAPPPPVAPPPAAPAATAAAKPPAPDNETDFACVLVDVHGEASEEMFTDPVAFARAYAAMWQKVNEEEDAQGLDALADFNADSLADAVLLSAEAQAILQRDASAPEEASTQQAIEPPVERGRINWVSYVKSLKAAAQTVGPDFFLAWADAQRDTVARCPPSQRPLAVRVIADAAAAARCERPTWLAALLNPRERPAAPPPTEEPPPASDEPLDDDEQWVEARLKDLTAIHSRAAFDSLVRSSAVRSTMARLRRDRPALFTRADAAFSLKHGELPAEGEA